MEILAIIALVFVFLFAIAKIYERPKDYPPGPVWFIPFIGNSHYLKKLSKKLGGQHKAFKFLAKELKSPLFSLKLGRENVVVATSYPVVKEILSRDDFSGRPDNFFIRLRTMGTRLGITCTDGKFWNEQRSFVVRHLRNIGYGKSAMHNKIDEELEETLKLLRNTNEKPIWPGGSNIISTSVLSILWTFTTGTKLKHNDKLLATLFELLKKRSKAFDISGGLLGQMPWLRFIAPEATGYNLIKDLNSKLFSFFTKIIDEHLETYSVEKSNDDLIYAFIKEMKEREDQADSNFTVTQLFTIILDIFIGGSQTTSTAIDLALMTMVIYPEIQKKCQEEIEKVVAVDGELPSYSDRLKTPYIDAVILEVHRFHSMVVGTPRRTLTDCRIQNFTIPRNTTVLVALGDAQNDENVLKDPKIFNPDRFLDENMKVTEVDKFFPFGIGRRKCLGDQLAKEWVYKYFVGILNEFILLKSPNEEDEPSLNLLPGIILTPRPYRVIFRKK